MTPHDDEEEPTTAESPQESDDEDDLSEDNDDGNVDCPVQCWDNHIVHVTDALIQDARRLWDLYGGDRTTASSIWVDATTSPRCLVEAVALQIANFHLPDIPYAGVEVWVQHRVTSSSASSNTTTAAGLELHFDKDEQAACRNVWKHPVVATATYLTTGGAPLVIFATASAETNEHNMAAADDDEEHDEVEDVTSATTKNNNDTDEKATKEDPLQHVAKKVKTAVETEEKKEHTTTVAEASDDNDDSSSVKTQNPDYAWMCYPRVGRHVAFAGNLLHGVLPELTLDSTAGGDRLSLLVNIWMDHPPAGVTGLSPEALAQLSKYDGTDTAVTTADHVHPIPPMELVVDLPANDDNTQSLLWLQEHNPGDTAPLPFQALQQQVKQGHNTPFVQITYHTQPRARRSRTQT